MNPITIIMGTVEVPCMCMDLFVYFLLVHEYSCFSSAPRRAHV